MCSFHCGIMGQIGEIFGFGLQGRIELESRAGTIAELLRIKMDGVDRTMRRKSLKERLGLNGMACCGATFGIGPTTVSVRDEEEEVGGPLGSAIEPIDATPSPIEDASASPCERRSTAATGMNLAAALAAERQFRASLDSDSGAGGESPGHSPSPPRPNSDEERSPNNRGTVPGTPARVSLMRLLEEADGWDGATMMRREEEGGLVGCDSVCCVCMGRKKGAAFIPCGHTFCRVCSREVWLNRGSCPLCNRLILEILDIY